MHAFRCVGYTSTDIIAQHDGQYHSLEALPLRLGRLHVPVRRHVQHAERGMSNELSIILSLTTNGTYKGMPLVVTATPTRDVDHEHRAG